MKRRKNILVLTHWSYRDPLVQTYTLPYVRLIRKNLPADANLLLVTFDQPSHAMNEEEILKAKETMKAEGISLQLFHYFKFNLLAPFRFLGVFLRLFYLLFRYRIDVIHAWCMPAGSMGYVLSLLTGRELIIDSYEPQAEAMVENGTWERTSMKFRIQFYLEKKLSHHASIIISATEGMRDYALKKYNVTFAKYYVKPACVDLEKFNFSADNNSGLRAELGLTNKLVCVYAGKFGGIYLTTEVFRFFHFAQSFWGDRFRVLLLTNQGESDLRQWAGISGFDPAKMIVRYVEHSRIPEYLSLGNFGITPVKPIPTKRYCTPIKDGEYWATGLPVVITKDISDDSQIISDENIGVVIEELNDEHFSSAVKKLDALLSDSALRLRSRLAAEKYRNFSIAEKIYSEVYSGRN